MSHTYSKSTSIVDESRFDEKTAPAKAFADGLLYKTADIFLHGTPLIVSGPDYFKHVRRGFTISRKPKVTHECVILIDMDEKVGRILRKKRKMHKRIDPEKASKVKILSGPEKGNVVYAESRRLEDLDLMETWNGRASSDALSAGDIFYIRIKKQLKKYPSRKHYKCVMLTAVRRNSRGGKATIVEGVNRTIAPVGAEIEDFEFTPRYPKDKGPWDRSNRAHTELSVYEQTPIWKKRGRIVKARFYTYQEKGKTPMFTCVIIWR